MSTNLEYPQFPEEFNLTDYFLYDRLQEGLGTNVAIRYGDRQFSYNDVAQRTKQLTKFFSSIGIEREQRILIVLPDAPPFAWSFFATLSYGAVVAMGNPAAPVEDLTYLLDYTRAQVLITTPDVVDSLAKTLLENRSLKRILLVPDTPTGGDCESNVDLPESLARVQIETSSLSAALELGAQITVKILPTTKRDDVAIWLFTSGSTGKSKAAVHTHRDFAFNTEVYAKRTVGYRRDDVTVSVPRLFFGYATGTNLMFPFSVGATTCLFSERPTPESLAKAIEMYKPSIVTNVPTMLAKLLDYDERQTREDKLGLDLSSVRFHLSAGEALPPALLERFTKRFPADVYDGIGSAEMFHIYVSNRPGDIKPGSLGKPVVGYTIRVLPSDAEGPGSNEVPIGETGVMWVKGDSIATGYFQDRDKSWQTFHGYWCRTGDLFRRDKDGYLWFVGRADDLFKVGGMWVSPLEVEDCLMSHPAVAMAAVIPAEEEKLTKPKAFVVVRESDQSQVNNAASKETLRVQLQEYVKERLSKHKYPRWVVFVEDLPKNDRGKVDRKLLVEMEMRGENLWK